MNEKLPSERLQPIDTASDRFDRLFWERLWRLARPYWNSPRRNRALLLLGVMIVLVMGTTGMQAIFSYLQRDLFNTLQAKNAGRFSHVLMLFGLGIALFVPIAAIYPYVTGLLSIDWREWLTETFVARMLNHNALYHIMRSHAVDNPDQRISEDNQQLHQRRAKLLNECITGGCNCGEFFRHLVDDFALARRMSNRVRANRHLAHRGDRPPARGN